MLEFIGLMGWFAVNVYFSITVGTSSVVMYLTDPCRFLWEKVEVFVVGTIIASSWVGFFLCSTLWEV